MEDSTFNFTMPCTATSGSAGGTCQVNTTANAIAPGTVRDGYRAVWQLGSIGLYDGAGGLLATQGVFIP